MRVLWSLLGLPTSLAIPFMAAVHPHLDEASPQVLQGSLSFPLRPCYTIFNILFLIALPAEDQIIVLKPCLLIHLNFYRLIMCSLPSGVNHCCVPYFNILRSHITQHTECLYIWCKDCRMAFYIKARHFKDFQTGLRSQRQTKRSLRKAIVAVSHTTEGHRIESKAQSPARAGVGPDEGMDQQMASRST